MLKQAELYSQYTAAQKTTLDPKVGLAYHMFTQMIKSGRVGEAEAWKISREASGFDVGYEEKDRVAWLESRNDAKEGELRRDVSDFVMQQYGRDTGIWDPQSIQNFSRGIRVSEKNTFDLEQEVYSVAVQISSSKSVTFEQGLDMAWSYIAPRFGTFLGQAQKDGPALAYQSTQEGATEDKEYTEMMWSADIILSLEEKMDSAYNGNIYDLYVIKNHTSPVPGFEDASPSRPVYEIGQRGGALSATPVYYRPNEERFLENGLTHEEWLVNKALHTGKSAEEHYVNTKRGTVPMGDHKSLPADLAWMTNPALYKRIHPKKYKVQ